MKKGQRTPHPHPSHPGKKPPAATPVPNVSSVPQADMGAEEDMESESQGVIAETSETADAIDTNDIKQWYQEDNDQMDMTKIERKTKRNTLPFIIGAIVVLIVLAGVALGYVLFRSQRSPETGAAVLALTVPEKTASGEAITLELTYENQDVVAIESGKLEVVYPDGFTFESAEPAPDSGTNQWMVADVAAGRGGKIYVTGQLVGEVGSTQHFSSFFTYRPANVNYDFQETATQDCVITSSIIGVSIEGPDRARSGQEIELTAEFKNNSKQPLQDIKAIVELPNGFSLTGTDPSLDESEEQSWRFDEIAAGESQLVTIRGTLEGDSGQQRQFTFQAGFIEFDGRFNAQVEKQQLVLLINPSLELEVEGPASVAPGDKVEYNIQVKNTSETELSQIKVKLLLEGEFFDEKQLDLAVIEKLKPNETKTLSTSTTIQKDIEARDLTLVAIASVRSLQVDGEQTTLNSTARWESFVEGSLNFLAQARYFDDGLSKIGSGPVPPKVGEQTTYVLWFDISTGPADIRDVTLTATLPDDVSFEAGDTGVIFNQKKHTIDYTTSVLRASSTKHIEVHVSITPTPDDFNTLMVLLESAQIQGVDTSSREALSAETDTLTTQLEGDPGAEGSGVVE